VKCLTRVSTLCLIGLAACETHTPDGSGPPIPPVPSSCQNISNPLDNAVCNELYGTDYKPLLADETELCTRLFVDLIGKRPSAERIANECAGRPIETAIDAIQATEEYRIEQRRRWADRFSYSDAVVDAMSIHDLDRMVDDLHQDRYRYQDFAIRALAHPGFVGRFNGYGQPDMTANAAFRIFLGRPATRPEMMDLGQLWRPWITGQGFIDRPADAVNYGYGSTPMIDPQACAAGKNSCESVLLGEAHIEFPADGRTNYLSIRDLTSSDWEAIRAPGRLITSLDSFWEAQVDETMKRFLGYDLGAMRPKARQDLVDIFRKDGGNVLNLEKIILSSWAYRQAAKEDPDHPRPERLHDVQFAYGPTKLMMAETWLHSIGEVVGRDVGDCDWRYPNLPEFPLADEQLALLGDIYPRDAAGSIDPTFRNLARKIGGCPGTFDPGSFSVTGRTNHIGLITAVAQEEALIELCFLSEVPGLLPSGALPNDTDVAILRDVAYHVLQRAQPASTIADADEAIDLIQTECPTCNADGVARGLCSGLLGGIEFMTY
jgi:hypothetical protein